MKVSPELSSAINIITKNSDTQYQKKTLDARSRETVADIISVENKQASQSRVENVDEAKRLLSSITKDMENASSQLYNLDFQRISSVIS
jgi:hypothetical protein